MSQAAARKQFDDERKLVEDLEVGDLGLAAGRGQDRERFLDERGNAAAEDDLLAKQIGLGLLPERGLDAAGSKATDGAGVSEGDLQGSLRDVLVHGHEAREPAARFEFRTDVAARPFRRNHDDVDVIGRPYQAEDDVEPVCERERVPLFEAGRDRPLIDVGHDFVGQQDHRNVALPACLGDGDGLESVLDGEPSAGALSLAHDDADAAVAQVECVGAALVAVADHCHGLALKILWAAVLLGVKFRHPWGFPVGERGAGL